MNGGVRGQAKGSRYNRRAHGFSPPKYPLKKKEKNIERPAGAVVYYSMNNFAGCIEGFATADRLRGLPKASSDLKSRNSERFDARLHGAGINDEENAGRYSKLMSGLDWEFSVAATSWSGEGYGLLVVSAPDNTAPHYPRNHGNPYIEKGMHTRTQLHFTFGGGDCSFANASEGFKGWGADEVASPRS